MGLLEEALLAGDERATEEFTVEELWELSMVLGTDDPEAASTVRFAGDLGQDLLDGLDDGSLAEGLALVFPEWAGMPDG